MAVTSVLLLLLVLLPSCSDESGSSTPDIPETQYAKLNIALGSLGNTMPAYTRATDYYKNDIINPDSADTQYEHHIEDWYIIVVDSDDKVDRIISNNSDIETFEQSNATVNNNDPDSKATISMELVVGKTYSFYALANIKGLENADAVIEALKGLKGKSFAEFRKTEATLKAIATAYTGETGTSYIPMSSYGKSIKVSNDERLNVVNLELIRLLGKVSIEVTNATGKEVTVKELKMGKFRQSGAIYLFPYDAINSDPYMPNLLIGKSAENDLMNPVFPTSETPVTGTDWIYKPAEGADDQVIGSDATDDQNRRKYMFYINETDQKSVDPNSGDIKIALEVEGIEKDSDPKETKFCFIRRNDLLQIPILLSKATTTIEFEQKHMPIGGLPTAITFEKGITISDKQLTTTHAGDITISYKLDQLNGSINWELQYYTEGGTTESKNQYCYAVPVANDSNFLLEPKDKDILSWWIDAATKPKYGYVLKKTNDLEGFFTVTAQELSYLGTAKIKLTLVAKHKTDDTVVILPYTLTITNGKTAKGGNR
ncbi:hypothetical protein DWU89_03225 [Parabacteroides acidifaciens]|nr:hypothetical protein DWU89_03225 [Parabacteroides acidifaciens]